jgi:hypothetical protein
MTISSVKTGAIGDSLLAGNAAFIPTDFESIATIVGNASASTITFSSIPSTYKHLQIRFISRRNSGGNAGNNSLYLRFNGSSSLIYTSHKLVGNGTTATAASDGVDASEMYLPNATAGSAQTAGVMSVGIIDIHDYASTTKNKTVRNITGNDSNGVNTGYISLSSGLYKATTAVTSISLVDASAIAFATSSVFSLYGIKG